MRKEEVKRIYNALILMCLLVSFSTVLAESHSSDSNKKDTSTQETHKKKRFSLSTTCNQNKNFSNKECDVLSPGPICSFNGEKIILPKKSPKGLVAHWSFDDVRVIDSTGNRNHARNMVKAGPSMSGQGSSGLFNNGNFISVPYNDSFDGNDYTITFWLFIIKDYLSQSRGIRYCPFVQRGKDDLFNKVFKRSPALYYDRVQKYLKVFVSTSSQDDPQGESMTSHSRINPQRWVHIGLVKSENKLKLYINGILDNTLNIKNEATFPKDEFFIGGVPWLKESCSYPFLIDEMRYYSIALQEELLQAEASPALGELDSSFLALGGMDVDVTTAANICTDGYHICTGIELHTGGYQVARSMGWLDWNTHIWSHGAIKTAAQFAGMKGLALCCADLR